MLSRGVSRVVARILHFQLGRGESACQPALLCRPPPSGGAGYIPDVCTDRTSRKQHSKSQVNLAIPENERTPCTCHGKLVYRSEPQAKYDLNNLLGRPWVIARHGLDHPLYTIRLSLSASIPLTRQ